MNKYLYVKTTRLQTEIITYLKISEMASLTVENMLEKISKILRIVDPRKR